LVTSNQRRSNSKDESARAEVEPASGALHISLRDYDSLKFELADVIREAGAAAWRAKQEKLQRECQSLLKHLAEDRFYLTLAGQFSRGKTSLMNAMFGMERLPTGVVPVTSVITAVSYNSRERVVIHFENSNLTHEIPLSDLREWITESGNPGNQRQIELAEVQLPAEILRRGAFFVDTPGLGSAVIENTATTHRFLPQIDALVLVTSFEFPLSQEEIVFLRNARVLQRKVFIVLNKADLPAQNQRREVLEFIRRRLAQEGDADDAPLFAVSATEGLAARAKRDENGLERSGLPRFERALVDYLVRDRYRDFAAAMCQRIETLLAAEEVPEFKELKARLEGVRANLILSKPPNHSSGKGAALETNSALKVSACFVCKRMADATFKFISQFQYDLSHSRDEQSHHASRSGFCTLHTREYARLASPQGIASGYPRTLLLIAERLRSLVRDGQPSENWREGLEGLLPNQDNCRACQVVAEREASVVNECVREWSAAPPDEDRLPCVCLKHLDAIVSKLQKPDLAKRLLLKSAAVLERTAENVQRFALRHGGLHMELTTDEELGSPEIGLNLLVGQPNVRAGRGD
jgi:GTP-binding protein EngB required for normal cell division